MIRFVLLTLAVLAIWPAPSAAAPEDAPVGLTVVVPNGAVYVHQRFEIALRVTVDTKWFETHAVQIFRQSLDLPLELRALWLTEIPGAAVSPIESVSGMPGRGLSLNGRAGTLHEVSHDGKRATFELRRSVLRSEPGDVVLAAPSLRYAFATKFEEDFVGGRVPLDRKDVTLPGTESVIAVRPLPIEGRPDGFVDAVGDFHIEASIARSELDVGERTTLHLRIEGPGNLGTLTPPTLRDIDGLHVFGVDDKLEGDRRTLSYDVAITSAARTSIPDIPLVFFNPGPPAGYVSAKTQALPLTVHSAAPTSSADVPTEGAVAPVPLDVSPDVPYGWIGTGIVLLIAVLLLLILSAAVPIRDLDSDGPERTRDSERIAAAESSVLANHDAPNETFGDDLAELLGAYLASPPASAVDPQLAAKLRAIDVPAEVADETATVMERLTAARYGGPPITEVDTAFLKRMLAALDASALP